MQMQRHLGAQLGAACADRQHRHRLATPAAGSLRAVIRQAEVDERDFGCLGVVAVQVQVQRRQLGGGAAPGGASAASSAGWLSARKSARYCRTSSSTRSFDGNSPRVWPSARAARRLAAAYSRPSSTTSLAAVAAISAAVMPASHAANPAPTSRDEPPPSRSSGRRGSGFAGPLAAPRGHEVAPAGPRGRRPEVASGGSSHGGSTAPMRAATVAARPMTYADAGRRSKRFGAGSITASRAADMVPSCAASVRK
jgi:hypothetical protein